MVLPVYLRCWNACVAGLMVDPVKSLRIKLVADDSIHANYLILLNYKPESYTLKNGRRQTRNN